MSGIKQLAGQTIWYGASSMAARFINYLVTPYLLYKLSTGEYGEQVILYSFIPFMNVLFTYGMETAFFRFTQNHDKHTIYGTANLSLLFSSVFLGIALIVFKEPIAQLLKLSNHTEYITIAAFIIALDAITTIPFAQLRLNGRPQKFALVKISGIAVYIAALYFFLTLCPALAKQQVPWITFWYHEEWKVGYVFVANLLQNIFTLLLLLKELLGTKLRFNKRVWQQMLLYALPIMIAGFGGMINETLDRIMLNWWTPATSGLNAKEQVGIYGACYKLAILITLAVQAFKMGAEPFFFKQSTQENAPKTYARIMKFFVITLCFMFLMVVLYIDVWKYFITNHRMWVGLQVVPILLLANIFLGIYYNLSIWYKLGHKTMAGAYITLTGAMVTIIINYLFIPRYGYMASAWATFACYGIMMIISYTWGQKNYAIPYAWKKLCAYIVIAVLVYLLHHFIAGWSTNSLLRHTTATMLFAAYFLFIFKFEKKEFQRFPIIGKLLR